MPNVSILLVADGLAGLIAFLSVVLGGLLLAFVASDGASGKGHDADPSLADDPAYKKLSSCQVRARPIMSGEQSALLANLKPWADERGFRLYPEVSLSAIFEVRHPSDQKLAFAAFATIRQKYLDILVTDREHRPIMGIEYHGSGHWSRWAQKRDAAKRAAFVAAGLPFQTVEHGYCPQTVIARLDGALAPKAPAPEKRVEPTLHPA